MDRWVSGTSPTWSNREITRPSTTTCPCSAWRRRPNTSALQVGGRRRGGGWEDRTSPPSLRLSSAALAPDAGAYAFYGGAEVVGRDGEGRELVGGYPLLEIAEVYGAAHAHQGGLATEGLEVRARVAAREAGYLIQVEIGVRGHLTGVD